MTAKKTQRRDANLQQIDDWGRWFLDAHIERLGAAGLTPTEYDRELAAVQALAAAVMERMRDDYQARKRGKP